MRYEELVRHPAACVADLLDWLGLAADPAVDEEIEERREPDAHGTSTRAEASIGRWRRDLPAADRSVVESVCGAWMERFGYLGSSA
jgi:hypothetical protein